MFIGFLKTKKTIKKILNLINDISRNGTLSGIGNPEALKGELSGFFSRRINDKDRLIYKLEDNIVKLFLWKGHFEDK